jgi:hypothetical protein
VARRWPVRDRTGNFLIGAAAEFSSALLLIWSACPRPEQALAEEISSAQGNFNVSAQVEQLLLMLIDR